MSAHTFAALGLLQRGFRPHPLVPGEKRPLSGGWQHEPDWSAEGVKARFDSAPEGAGLGLRCDGLVVIDVDVKKGGAGTLAELEHELGPLPDTVRVKTPSGGEHIYLASKAPLRNTVEKLGPGIDTRVGSGGQVAAPPTPGYAWLSGEDAEVAPLPEAWLVALLGVDRVPEPPPAPKATALRSAGDRELARRRAAAYLATLPPAISGQGGHAQLFAAACRAVELCLDRADVVAVLTDYNARCEPPFSEADLAHKVDDALKAHRLGERLDESSPASATPTPGAASYLLYVRQLEAWLGRSPDRRTWDIAHPLCDSTAVAILVHEAGIPVERAREIVSKKAAGYAVYVDICARAGASFIDKDGNLVVNNYVPPALMAKAGDFPVISSMLDFFTSGDAGLRRWLENWLARCVQKPDERIKTAPIVYTNQGSGKNPFFEVIMGAIMGAENTTLVTNDDIDSRFTASFAQKLLVVVDELRGEDSRTITPRMKSLCGSVKIRVEAKGVSSFTLPNHIKLVGLSNDTHPLEDEEGGTRWAHFRNFAKVTKEHRARIATLFTGPASGILNERGLAEAAAFAAYLQALEVDEELVNSPPDSDARTLAVEASRGSVEQFIAAVEEQGLDAVWMEVVPEYRRTEEVFKRGLDIPAHPELVGLAAIYATYVAYCLANSMKPVKKARFDGERERYRPSWAKDRPNVYGDDGDRERMVVYKGVPRRRAARGLVVVPPHELPSTPPEDVPENVRQAALALGAVADLDARRREVEAAFPGLKPAINKKENQS